MNLSKSRVIKYNFSSMGFSAQGIKYTYVTDKYKEIANKREKLKLSVDKFLAESFYELDTIHQLIGDPSTFSTALTWYPYLSYIKYGVLSLLLLMFN